MLVTHSTTSNTAAMAAAGASGALEPKANAKGPTGAAAAPLNAGAADPKVDSRVDALRDATLSVQAQANANGGAAAASAAGAVAVLPLSPTVKHLGKSPSKLKALSPLPVTKVLQTEQFVDAAIAKLNKLHQAHPTTFATGLMQKLNEQLDIKKHPTANDAKMKILTTVYRFAVKFLKNFLEKTKEEKFKFLAELRKVIQLKLDAADTAEQEMYARPKESTGINEHVVFFRKQDVFIDRQKDVFALMGCVREHLLDTNPPPALEGFKFDLFDVPEVNYRDPVKSLEAALVLNADFRDKPSYPCLDQWIAKLIPPNEESNPQAWRKNIRDQWFELELRSELTDTKAAKELYRLDDELTKVGNGYSPNKFHGMIEALRTPNSTGDSNHSKLIDAINQDYDLPELLMLLYSYNQCVNKRDSKKADHAKTDFKSQETPTQNAIEYAENFHSNVLMFDEVILDHVDHDSFNEKLFWSFVKTTYTFNHKVVQRNGDFLIANKPVLDCIVKRILKEMQDNVEGDTETAAAPQTPPKAKGAAQSSSAGEPASATKTG